MIQVNLLPWRQEARTIKKTRFTILSIAFALLGLVMVIFFHVYFKTELNQQKQINHYLQSEIDKEQAIVTAVSAQQKQKIEIATQLNFIIGLYSQNYQAVQLFNELIALIPSSIVLSRIEKKGSNITLEGTAPSSSEITHFIQNISKSTILTQPVLSEINVAKKGNEIKRSFQITMVQKG